MFRYWLLVDESTLFYGGDWEEYKGSIRALTFGVMVELSDGVIQHYQSDLYHDAKWLEQNLVGPMSFEWVARESGTFIGASAETCDLDQWAGAIKYRFELLNEENKWKLRVYRSTPDYHDELPVKDCDKATTVAGCIHHPAQYLYNCTGEYDINGVLIHDGVMCYQHEVAPIDEILEEANNPTHGNGAPNVPNIEKGKISMDDIIRDLEDKQRDAEAAREELNEFKYELDNALDDLNSYLDDLQTLLDSLTEMPSVDVSVSIDVAFDSDR